MRFETNEKLAYCALSQKIIMHHLWEKMQYEIFLCHSHVQSYCAPIRPTTKVGPYEQTSNDALQHAKIQMMQQIQSKINMKDTIQMK